MSHCAGCGFDFVSCICSDGKDVLENELPPEEETPMAWQGNGNTRQTKEPYKHKENRGSMFENDRKEKETQPDFKGSIDIEGLVYWIHGWKGTTQKGAKKLSLSVQRQDEHMAQPPQQSQPPRRQSSGW